MSVPITVAAFTKIAEAEEARRAAPPVAKILYLVSI